MLSVTVCQQGDRLGHARPRGRDDGFIPSPFSLILIDSDNNVI